MNQPIQTPATPTYSGGGIGSDAARTGDRQWGDPSWWSGGGIGSDAGATGGRYDPSTGYYTGGGIGSDAGATGGRYDFGDYALTPSELRDALAMRLGQQAEILGTSGGESSYPYQPPPNTKMGIGPENLPPTPFGGGFNMRPPTYNNRNEFNQPGTGQIAPPGDQPWAFPGYTPPSSSVPGMDPSWPGYGPGMQPNWGGWDNFNAPPSPGGA
jgi:hypothetical protein